MSPPDRSCFIVDAPPEDPFEPVNSAARAPEIGGNESKRLSVCIPAYNEASNLPRLLGFLQKERIVGGVISEVLVEASGSTDGTPFAVEAMSASWGAIKLLPLASRKGLAEALNLLLASAKEDLIIRIDADVVPDKGCLSYLIARFDSDKVGIVGPRVVPASTGNDFCDLIAETEYELHHLVSMRYPKTTVIQAMRHPPSALPADAGSEDVLLQDSIESGGRYALYEPRAIVHIQPPCSVGEFLRQRVRTVRANRWASSHLHVRAPTQRLGAVAGATRSGLARKSLALRGLIPFVLIEAFAQLVAAVSSPFLSQESIALFVPSPTTKTPTWRE